MQPIRTSTTIHGTVRGIETEGNGHPGVLETALLVVLGGLALLAAALLLLQTARPEPLYLPGFTVDRVSALVALLVAGVGTVAYHFSLRYLHGEPGQARFLRRLFFTVSVAYLLMFATNLLVLFATWLCTSLGLHQLLTFYRGRAAAHPPARKKFLISRLGDVALLSAIIVIWAQWGTLDLNAFLARLQEPVAWASASTAVALLLVTAALTKSAQFPFHSWLPETMEAPTPVSALMHAGIINAGGVLLLHFAPLLATEPLALFNLALVGSLTAVLGMLAMWAQVNVKRTLAWSTVSQMGFMMIQLGLAVFPAALLHLVGHGLYKAWLFLRTGDVPGPARAAPDLAPTKALGYGLLGAAIAVPALALAALVTGFNPFHSPGELALTAIVALGIGQGWVARLRTPAASADAIRSRAVTGILGTVAIAFLALILYKAAGAFVGPVLGPVPALRGPLAWSAAILPVAAFLLLMVVQAYLPQWQKSPAGRAFYIHAFHGFYIGVVADRLVHRVWTALDLAAAGVPVKHEAPAEKPLQEKVEHAG